MLIYSGSLDADMYVNSTMSCFDSFEEYPRTQLKRRLNTTRIFDCGFL